MDELITPQKIIPVGKKKKVSTLDHPAEIHPDRPFPSISVKTLPLRGGELTNQVNKNTIFLSRRKLLVYRIELQWWCKKTMETRFDEIGPGR